MGWLIALGVIVALALLPLGLSLRYDDNGFQMYAISGLIRIPLSGKQKDKGGKKKKKKEKKGKNKNKTGKSSAGSPKKKKGGSLTDFLPIAQVVLTALDDLRRKLRIRRLEMKLVMAADDPCDLAVNYGRAWVALGNLIPRLERYFVIRKRDLEVECDFEASKTLITARLDLTITIGRLLYIVLFHGLRAVKEFINLKNLRKGGASK